jgi:type II secretory pathway pseudopilin PulG
MSSRVIQRLRRTRAEGGEAGMTLTEVLVAMGLSMVIGAMTLGLFLSIGDTTTRATDRTTTSASARNAIQAWTAYLRVADGTTAGSRTNRVEWLTANDMLFYSDLNNRSLDSVATTSPPTMIWLRRDTANRLVEEQFVSTATAGATPTRCRLLVNRLTGSAPVFSALDSGGHTLSNLGAAPTPSSGCRTLPVTVPSRQSHPDLTAQANLQNVYSVTIDFQATDTQGKHPIEFTSQAVLPSMGAVG